MEQLHADVLKKSMITAVINGGINAAISTGTFFKYGSIPITLDHISNQEITVFGQGVLLALTISFMSTGINYLTFSKELKKKHEGIPFPHPFWPWGVKLALKNVLAAFGAAMIVAVLWQRFIGTIMVSPLAATMIMFVIAFFLVLYVSMSTMQSMLDTYAGDKANGA